jgi:hypothetical protein
MKLPLDVLNNIIHNLDVESSELMYNINLQVNGIDVNFVD